MDPPLGNPGGGFMPGDPIDFDDLVDEYLQLEKDDLELHYRASKEALIRKLGGSAKPGP
jgi:hypothetical protein